MFEITELGIHGAYLIRGPKFEDQRGTFVKSVHQATFEKFSLEWRFPEQFYSVSKRNVLRGMHFQIPPFDQVKLVYCVSGKALDVILDLRKESPTFGKCESIELEGGDGQSVYIPRGLAHGFLSRADDTIVMYSVTSMHEAQHDRGVHWQSISFDWGITQPIVSPRDQTMPALKDLKTPF